MGRLLVASNRLPVTVSVEGGDVRVSQSVGGLATGLAGPHERSGGAWIGWTGLTAPLEPAQAGRVDGELERQRLVPVALSQDEVARYYEDYSNGLVWPVFHSFVGQLPLEIRGWDDYERVNARFADAIARAWRPGDTVWVQDYQLMRVPALVRERVPEARIGFFLHIPFPPSELFRILPQREALLAGMLGADLVGFHTASYLRHFASSVLRVLGTPVDLDGLEWGGRRVRLGVFPMGVDAAHWSELGASPEVTSRADEARSEGVQLLVGVDRLDYTKGIARRLLAYEHLLRAHPELQGRVRLVQVAVPSRTGAVVYRDFREQIDGLVGRINGAFGTATWSPVHYLFRALPEVEIAALYRAAHAALVTPIRDGMNLVAKEFVATRADGDGVLVLSEFAGAASELAEALTVNPYDVDGTAEALRVALEMPVDERRARMSALRRRVQTSDVHAWADAFLGALARETHRPAELAPSPPEALGRASELVRSAARATLLLDYDGTLVEFARTPELARPDPALLALLARLAARFTVHVVSGRRRDVLEAWLGALPVGLHAEHGTWSRAVGGSWVGVPATRGAWGPPVREVLDDWAARTPGSLVEEKTAGYAWHWRAVEPLFGDAQARDLLAHLTAMLGSSAAEVVLGNKVIEVRARGIDKGRVVKALRAGAPADTRFLGAGDDTTDEDLFAALPDDAVSIHVGPGPSRARLRVPDVPSMRRLLRGLLA